MDPIVQLGKDAYHALCIAFAAQSKEKLYSPETDVLLEDARDLLNVTEEEDRAIRAQIDQDPMIAALRRGEVPPGGIRPLLLPSSRSGTTQGVMPPPAAGPAAAPAATTGGGGFETPFSTQQQKAAAKKTTATPNSGAAASAAATTATPGPGAPPRGEGATGSALVGRKLQRLIPDLSPPWVTGTVMSYNAGTGRHLIQWGPPLRRESWECIADFAPQNFRWLDPGAEPSGPTGGGGSKAGGGSKTGGSKSTPKSSTPKAAAPPPPAPKATPSTPAAVPAAAPAVPAAIVTGLLLAGGPSTHHATGVSLTSAPYNESFLRSCLAKNRPEDLSIMLSTVDEREVVGVRELVALLEDPGDIAEINRLLEESQQMAAQEQQLRADLRELGVMG